MFWLVLIGLFFIYDRLDFIGKQINWVGLILQTTNTYLVGLNDNLRHIAYKGENLEDMDLELDLEEEIKLN